MIIIAGIKAVATISRYNSKYSPKRHSEAKRPTVGNLIKNNKGNNNRERENDIPYNREQS